MTANVNEGVGARVQSTHAKKMKQEADNTIRTVSSIRQQEFWGVVNLPINTCPNVTTALEHTDMAQGKPIHSVWKVSTQGA